MSTNTNCRKMFYLSWFTCLVNHLSKRETSTFDQRLQTWLTSDMMVMMLVHWSTHEVEVEVKGELLILHSRDKSRHQMYESSSQSPAYVELLSTIVTRSVRLLVSTDLLRRSEVTRRNMAIFLTIRDKELFLWIDWFVSTSWCWRKSSRRSLMRTYVVKLWALGSRSLLYRTGTSKLSWRCATRM